MAADIKKVVLAYSGGLENRPGSLLHLEHRGAVLGNGAGAVRALRDPTVFFSVLRREGIPIRRPGSPTTGPGQAVPRDICGRGCDPAGVCG